MTKNLIWLASYPKSGNTWTRAFIGSILGFGTINDKGAFSQFTSSCASAVVRRQIYGEETPPETDLTHAWRVPYQERLSARIGKARHFVKTHSRYGTVSGNRLIEPSVSLAAVIIVRNPFDVAVSMANYLTTSVDNGIKVIANPALTLNNANRVQHTISVGSWDLNIVSWLAQSEIPTLLMRYEDMYFEPEESFGRLAREVLGIANPERIARAIEEARFDNLREKEATHGFNENISKVNPFFFKGYPYHALDILGPAEKEAIWQRHRLVAEALGYRFDGDAITLAPPDPSVFPALAWEWGHLINAA